MVECLYSCSESLWINFITTDSLFIIFTLPPFIKRRIFLSAYLVKYFTLYSNVVTKNQSIFLFIFRCALVLTLATCLTQVDCQVCWSESHIFFSNSKEEICIVFDWVFSGISSGNRRLVIEPMLFLYQWLNVYIFASWNTFFSRLVWLVYRSCNVTLLKQNKRFWVWIRFLVHKQVVI